MSGRASGVLLSFLAMRGSKNGAFSVYKAITNKCIVE
jgi:hypothetical protein